MLKDMIQQLSTPKPSVPAAAPLSENDGVNGGQDLTTEENAERRWRLQVGRRRTTIETLTRQLTSAQAAVETESDRLAELMTEGGRRANQAEEGALRVMEEEVRALDRALKKAKEKHDTDQQALRESRVVAQRARARQLLSAYREIGAEIDCALSALADTVSGKLLPIHRELDGLGNVELSNRLKDTVRKFGYVLALKIPEFADPAVIGLRPFLDFNQSKPKRALVDFMPTTDVLTRIKF